MDRRRFLSGIAATAAVPTQAETSSVAALSIGISRYRALPVLPSAVRDAKLIGAHFLGLGFDTEVLTDPDTDDVLRAMARWRIRARGCATAVLYVAGHGFWNNGETYFSACDAQDYWRSALSSSFSEHVALRAVSDAPRNKILFLDCCRDVSQFDGVFAPSPAEPAFAPAGSFSLYAAQPNAPAQDGGNENSPFADGLALGLQTRRVDIADLSRSVRRYVVRETAGLQVPWSRSSLMSKVVLNP